MVHSTLNDRRICLTAAADCSGRHFPPELYCLTEKCGIAPSDLNDERFTEKYRIAMKTTTGTCPDE